MREKTERLSEASVLRLIRDGIANSHSSLREYFGAVGEANHRLYAILGDLQKAKLVERKDATDSLRVTRKWMELQNLLQLNLTTQLELEHGAIALRPFFGLPKTDPHFKLDVFVLTSFAPSLKPVFEDHILKVTEKLRLTVQRADNFFGVQNIMEEIWAAIYNSRVVIADCTGRNPNVFYEIGMSHAVGKPVILITQNADDVPFDLKAVRYIEYQYTPRGMADFEEKLTRTLRQITLSDH